MRQRYTAWPVAMSVFIVFIIVVLCCLSFASLMCDSHRASCVSLVGLEFNV